MYSANYLLSERERQKQLWELKTTSDVGGKLIHLLLCLVSNWGYKADGALKELPVEREDRYLVRGTLVVFHLGRTLE